RKAGPPPCKGSHVKQIELDQRIGQVSITVNGECVTPADSQSPQFPFAQRTFGIKDGIGTGAPGFVDVEGGPVAVYDAAIAWLTAMRAKLEDGVRCTGAPSSRRSSRCRWSRHSRRSCRSRCPVRCARR